MSNGSELYAKNEIDSKKKLASILSLVFGFILLCMKFYAYHITDSKAIYSDALESIVNVVAGIITLIVLYISAMPADEDHPYGHGKIESMAATFEGGAILFAGILIVIESIQTLFHGANIRELNSGLVIVILAGLVNGLMGLFLIGIGRTNHSEALRSSGAHLLTDAFTSLGVLVGLLLVKFTGLVWLDPVVAILFGLMLAYTGGKILFRSGNNLLDAVDPENLNLIIKLFEKHHRPGVIQIHFTRVIRSGAYHHIDCHMVVPEFWPINKAHDFANEYEDTIMKDYPVKGELHVHLDPCRQKHCVHCELSDCPIRIEKFDHRHPYEIKEIVSPTESV